MNEWNEIKAIFHNRVKTNISQYLMTMLSMILFVLNNFYLQITVTHADENRVHKSLKHIYRGTKGLFI